MRLRDNGRLYRLRSLAACMMLAAAVAGCASGPHLPPSQAQALLRIMGGMSREEVVSQLGAPHRQETVGRTEFLFYRTDWRTATESEKFSPVAIVDGRVVGLGRVYYQDTFKAEQKRAATAAAQSDAGAGG